MAITVVIAAVVYIMATGFIQVISSPPPPIVLTEKPTGEPGVTILEVSGTEPKTYPIAKFDLRLLINSSQDDASAMTPLSGGTTGNVTFEDMDGRLTIGDMFTVETVPGTTYKILLLWKETGGIASQHQWTT
ncbi:MAG: hypothetical protein HY557_00065 [Euryarchaeota archaeon]|nr:hypothetical protein [Euryarchaeota archaeon]